MADELKVNGSIRFRKGDVDIAWDLKEVSDDITNDQYIKTRAVLAATVELELDIASLTANQRGYAVFRNAEPKTSSHEIDIRCKTGSDYSFSTLKGQQFAILPLDNAQTYYAYAATGTPALDYLIVEE